MHGLKLGSSYVIQYVCSMGYAHTTCVVVPSDELFERLRLNDLVSVARKPSSAGQSLSALLCDWLVNDCSTACRALGGH